MNVRVNEGHSNPANGSWQLLTGINGPFLAPSAGTWTQTVTYTGPTGTSLTSGSPINRQWTVFTVAPYTLPNVANDVVNTTGNLRYAAGNPDIVASDVVASHDTREIRNGFVVTGPVNNFANIQVGFIQPLN